MKKQLLGCLVDETLYQKYSRRSFPVQGISMGIEQLYPWATRKEIAEALPVYAATAVQHWREVAQELKEDGVQPAQLPSDFNTLLMRLHVLYTDGKKQAATLKRDLEIARNEHAVTTNDPMSSNLDKQFSKAKLEKANAEFAAGMNKLKEIYKQYVEDFLRTAKNTTEKLFCVHTDMLDTAALRLIESGLAGAKELWEMAEQYRGNYTMLLVLFRQAEKEAGTAKDKGTYWELITYLKNKTDPAELLNDFEVAVKVVAASVTTPEHLESAWDRRYCEAIAAICSRLVSVVL